MAILLYKNKSLRAQFENKEATVSETVASFNALIALFQ